MDEKRGRHLLLVVMIVVFAAWCLFGWLSYRMVEPYVAGPVLTVWVSVILGFLSLSLIVFICLALIAVVAALLPKRSERAAG